jgi:hypothetical protein
MPCDVRIVPVTLAEANMYIAHFHRHNGALPSSKFACAAITRDGQVQGVAVAGLCKARELMARDTLEINRVCTADGAEKNLCSMLYAACLRAGKALGYRRFVTYTLEAESGVSLRASGWTPVSTWSGGKWSELRGTGSDRHDTGPKVRWEIVRGAVVCPSLVWPMPTAQRSLFDVETDDRPETVDRSTDRPTTDPVETGLGTTVGDRASRSLARSET